MADKSEEQVILQNIIDQLAEMTINDQEKLDENYFKENYGRIQEQGRKLLEQLNIILEKINNYKFLNYQLDHIKKIFGKTITNYNNIKNYSKQSQEVNEILQLIKYFETALTGFRSLFLKMQGQTFEFNYVFSFQDEGKTTIKILSSSDFRTYSKMSDLVGRYTKNSQEIMEDLKNDLINGQINTISDNLIDLYKEISRRLSISKKIIKMRGNWRYLMVKINKRWKVGYIANYGDLNEAIVAAWYDQKNYFINEEGIENFFNNYIHKVDNKSGYFYQDIQKGKKEISIKSFQATASQLSPIILLLKKLVSITTYQEFKRQLPQRIEDNRGLRNRFYTKQQVIEQLDRVKTETESKFNSMKNKIIKQIRLTN